MIITRSFLFIPNESELFHAIHSLIGLFIVFISQELVLLASATRKELGLLRCFVELISETIIFITVVVHTEDHRGLDLTVRQLRPIDAREEGVLLDLGDRDSFFWPLVQHFHEEVPCVDGDDAWDL